MISKHWLIGFACFVLVFAGAGFLVLRHPGFLNAQTNDSSYKNFPKKDTAFRLIIRKIGLSISVTTVTPRD